MITTSQKQTISLGKKLAKKLKGGEVFLLHGDLGAGKTTFVKGIAEGLKIDKIINSPTFVIMKIYNIQDSKFKIQNLIHIDCYRGLDLDDLGEIGLFDYLGDSETVCFIEWGKHLEKYLKKNKINFQEIKIKNLDLNKREIIIK